MEKIHLLVDKLCCVWRIGDRGCWKNKGSLQSMSRYSASQKVHLRKDLATLCTFWNKTEEFSERKKSYGKICLNANADSVLKLILLYFKVHCKKYTSDLFLLISGTLKFISYYRQKLFLPLCWGMVHFVNSWDFKRSVCHFFICQVL